MVTRMKIFVTVATLAAASVAIADRPEPGDASPVFGVRLPKTYRQWQLITAAHEAGKLNDIRVVLGNDIAVKAFRRGRRPFPDGAILARIAWRLVPSARNDAVFGQPQSFVAGEPTNVQIEVKDRRRYAATGGWGYGQFEDGRANPDASLMRTCFACHAKLPPSDDFIFTTYSR